MVRPNRIVYLCSSDEETFVSFEDILLYAQWSLDYVVLLEYCVQDLSLLPWDVFLGNLNVDFYIFHLGISGLLKNLSLNFHPETIKNCDIICFLKHTTCSFQAN